MTRKSRSWQSRALAGLGAAGVVGYLIFGSFGEKTGPVDVGQRRVTAQPSGTIPGTSFTAPLGTGGLVPTTNTASATPQMLRDIEENLERREDAMARRAAGLPASDPRVQAAAPPPLAATQSTVRAVPASATPGRLADADFTYFRSTELDPPPTFSSSVNEPSVAQNGKNAFMTWNWFAARSLDGGATWAYIDPFAASPAMPDFCCDQDVIYEKGRDRMFWERMGYLDVDATANNQNRIVINVSADGFVSSPCYADLRGTMFGVNNAFLDYPRMALSDNFLYISANIFQFDPPGNYVTHLLLRLDLGLLSSCTSLTGTYWLFPDGWNPTLVENAREIMYLGDQIVTNGGLNDQFRVYWIFDDNTTLNLVDRTITPYLFTNRFGAHCPVPGGVDPCQRSDQRVSGAVLEHNTPVPGNLGAAGDKIDFYWNVREGNGFPLPFVESAGFFGNTIAYVQRKIIWNPSLTFFYAAAGANDREHVGISMLLFYPVASATNPRQGFALDDDYNTNPPGWEVYSIGSTGPWTQSQSGDYLRLRSINPPGVGWVASGYRRNAAAGEYRPLYTAFGRARDLAGFNRFDQK